MKKIIIGFAVVSEEIRKLAEQSSKSIENVIEVTRDIQNKLDDFLKAFGDNYKLKLLYVIIIRNK